jgi:hypothetical protein
MKVVEYSSKSPSIQAHLALAPAANAAVHMEDSEAVMGECRDVAMPQVQRAKQQESLEVAQTDLNYQKVEAGANEVDVLMEGSPQAISDADPVTASQPTCPKCPPPQKKKGGEGRVTVPTYK